MVTLRANWPMYDSKRSCIADTPERVKVRHSTPFASVSVFSSMLAMRKVSTWVLPVPGPATTITGPSMASTACFWAVFRAL